MKKIICLSLCLLSLLSCKKHEERWKNIPVNTYSKETQLAPDSWFYAKYTLDPNGNLRVTGNDSNTGHSVNLTEQIQFDTTYVQHLDGDEYANIHFDVQDCDLEVYQVATDHVLYHFSRSTMSGFPPSFKPTPGSLFCFVSNGERTMRFFEGPYGTEIYKSYQSYVVDYNKIVSLSGEFLGEFNSPLRVAFGDIISHPDQYLWTDPLTVYHFLLSQQQLVYMTKYDLTQTEVVWETIHTLPNPNPAFPESFQVNAVLASPDRIELGITAAYSDGSTQAFALDVNPTTGAATDK